MKREECNEQIIDLMIQIRDVYRKYDPDGEYLSFAIMDNTLMANNVSKRNKVQQKVLQLLSYYDIIIVEREKEKQI